MSPNRNKSRLPYLDQNMCGKVVPVEKLVKMMRLLQASELAQPPDKEVHPSLRYYFQKI
jgi:hypothetical protein